MLKKIWNDPVWSKVISSAIIAGGALAYSTLISSSPLLTIVAGITASLAMAFAISLIFMQLVQKLRQPIQWDFSGYFLGMSAVEGKNIHVSAFQARGYNRTRRHFRHVGGYLESNVNGEHVPLLLESMPPEQTNGIPPACNFWIRAIFRDATAPREGIEAENFLQRFSEFTFVVELDGKKYSKRFPPKVVRKQISSFWQESNPVPPATITERDS
jgi:hypothetical protein